MKDLLKKAVVAALALALCLGIWGDAGTLSATFGSSNASAEGITISPMAAIIEWRYKSINGRIHKRQYNCTTQQWIGEWVPC